MDDGDSDGEADGASGAKAPSSASGLNTVTPKKGVKAEPQENASGGNSSTRRRMRSSPVSSPGPSPSSKAAMVGQGFDAMSFLKAKIGAGGSSCGSIDGSSRLSGSGMPASVNGDEAKFKKSDWNKKKTVQDHIRDISLSSILGGGKLKVALRFARLALAEIDAKVDVASHSLLSVHLRSSDHCYALVDADWETIELDSLVQLVTPIVDAQIEFPTPMKMKLLIKHAMAVCSSLGVLTDENLKKLCNMITPWLTSDDGVDFDAQQPCLVSIEGSPK